MRRKLIMNCSEAGKLVSSCKRSKTDSQESTHSDEESLGAQPINPVEQSEQTSEITKDEKCVITSIENQEELKKRRKKVVLFMAYNGFGYHGMQYNTGFKTIEGELLEALSIAGAIDEENKGQLGSLKFQRASKTDKGVSAVRQIVSLKIDISKDYLEAINTHLSPQIRLFRIIRATQAFNAKHFCTSRFYSYVCPTFALAPTYEQTYEGYRIDEKTVDRLKEVLKTFKGTHNFHNYTSGVKATSPSCNRYIIDISTGCPFMDQKSNLEFITIQLHGQSFMLHQIRKMVGITIAVMKNFADIEIIARSFKLDTIETPKAPSLGLMLDRQEFKGYNNKYGHDGIHEPIEWDSKEDEVCEFRNNFIYPHIFQQEAEEKSMFCWLALLKKHNFTEETPQKTDESAKETVEQMPISSQQTSCISETKNEEIVESPNLQLDEAKTVLEGPMA